MTLDEFQKMVGSYRKVKDKKIPDFIYPAMGLGGEAGEVLEEIKKSIREGDGTYIPGHRMEKIFLELGDVLHYAAFLSSVLGFTLEDIAVAHEEKLKKKRWPKDATLVTKS